MPQETRAPRRSKRLRRPSKRASDSSSIFLGAIGIIDSRPYPVITPGSKDPFPGLFGTCRKRFSDAPKGCTKAEIDSDLAMMRAQLPTPPMKDTPKLCEQAGIDSDLAEMRAQLPKTPIQVTQHSETAGVIESARAALPACTKRVRIILRVSASGNRITKKPPTSKKRKPLDLPQTLASTEEFKMPATLNRPKPLKAPRTSSPQKPKVKESQPLLRRSPRPKNPTKFSN